MPLQHNTSDKNLLEWHNFKLAKPVASAEKKRRTLFFYLCRGSAQTREMPDFIQEVV